MNQISNIEITEEADYRFLRKALTCSEKSMDPATRVGAIIVVRGSIVASGYNKFPFGVQETPQRLYDRDTKLKLMVHAELAAMLDAARVGVRISGGTLYLAATDDTGEVWGGPPCMRCSTHLIEAGITRVVSYPAKLVSKWRDELQAAGEILREANVCHVEYAYLRD